jgi:Spy/CpxP family protein refolding chaperone
MKKIITSALILALTIGAAQAQTTPVKKEKAKKEHRLQKLDDVNLTAEQKAQLKTIRENHKKEVAALKAEKKATQQQRQELNKKYHEQMQSVLTAEQKQQFAKLQQDKKANRKKGAFKNNRKNEAKIAQAKTKRNHQRNSAIQKQLNLSEQQKAEIAKIRTDFKPQMEALKKDNTLTREQKQAKMKELMKAQQEQTKAVLTKEQQEKMQALRKNRNEKRQHRSEKAKK